MKEKIMKRKERKYFLIKKDNEKCVKKTNVSSKETRKKRRKNLKGNKKDDKIPT